MFYDYIYLAKGFRMRPKVRSTLKQYNLHYLPIILVNVAHRSIFDLYLELYIWSFPQQNGLYDAML